ncbi:rhodanese-like domain-containing protein [Ectobacillus sp. JY-23]|uniref:rhodanese-like domain-containing protein n=1 Tax=Ectobacillus sp. JY-23 TaxID=2933872 RepID=UPI001FF5B833|nr:rhodanese-like domain-containing protein [Ectobacillus sp. JY-23]UOY94355.1 rhodanese-like domain-containing protein [Ectobacillus sp. JY-23]
MHEVQTITPEEVQARLEQGETLHLVDVREDDEIAFYGKIPEATHIKMGDIPNKLDYFNKEDAYIFICKAGVRSEHVCMYMQEQGYKAINMIGGMSYYTGKTE